MADEEGTGSGSRRTLMIVLGVIGALSLVGCIACAAGGMFCASQVPAPAPREPARVEASLYYGTWTGAGPTTLTIDPGSVHWQQQSGSGNVQYNGGFSGISGQNILVNVLVTDVTLVVSDPPHLDPASGRWTMTVEGVRLEHP
jgi:hypothetical protein